MEKKTSHSIFIFIFSTIKRFWPQQPPRMDWNVFIEVWTKSECDNLFKCTYYAFSDITFHVVSYTALSECKKKRKKKSLQSLKNRTTNGVIDSQKKELILKRPKGVVSNSRLTFCTNIRRLVTKKQNKKKLCLWSSLAAREHHVLWPALKHHSWGCILKELGSYLEDDVFRAAKARPRCIDSQRMRI